MLQTDKKIFIAVPCMDELETLPVFIECVRNQSYKNYKLIVCVNQPDFWWNEDNKKRICYKNLQSIKYLQGITGIDIKIIDKSSKGFGWKDKKLGVGWARKTIMDHISKEAGTEDIIISLDADTVFSPGYFQSVVENLYEHNKAVALSVPYYHKLTGDKIKDRAILHYEIYMRYYAINLGRIENPYSFTAIGSAIALPVKAYKAIGGITPHKSGEDFYFLQKLRKYGEVLTWNKEKVYPAARYSDRVGFGTGPAMIKGRVGDWSSYPLYPFELFDEVKKTYDLFPSLFEKDVPTPMDEFNALKFNDQNIWQPLRENFKTRDKFVKACYHKIDAFRILQYLKWRNNGKKSNDEENLIFWLKYFYKDQVLNFSFDISKISFTESPVEDLDQIRNTLANIEKKFQKVNVVIVKNLKTNTVDR
ncbi:MAG: glycosyltransferase [Bacteroidales bacterium]|nr:glycosyltransferase [Bacteroidales bacterium]